MTMEERESQLQGHLSTLLGCFNSEELQERVVEMRKPVQISSHTQDATYASLLPMAQESHQLQLKLTFIRQRLDDQLALRDRRFCAKAEGQSDSTKLGSLQRWYQQLKAFSVSFSNLGDDLPVLGQLVKEDQLCSNVQLEIVDGNESLSFTTRRKGFTYHIQLNHNVDSGDVSVEGDTYLRGLKELYQQHLTNGYPCDAFIRMVIWPLIEGTVPLD